jgi:hypothetical protein
MREHICAGPEESQADATGPTMEGLSTIALPRSASSGRAADRGTGRGPGRSRYREDIKASHGRAHPAFPCGAVSSTLIRIATDLILHRTSWYRNFGTTTMMHTPGPADLRRSRANRPARWADAQCHAIGQDLAPSLARQRDSPGVNTIRCTPCPVLADRIPRTVLHSTDGPVMPPGGYCLRIAQRDQ